MAVIMSAAAGPANKMGESDEVQARVVTDPPFNSLILCQLIRLPCFPLRIPSVLR